MHRTTSKGTAGAAAASSAATFLFCFLCLSLTLLTAGCSNSGSDTPPARVSDRYDPKTGTSASQRIVQYGQSVPKGGGHYKLGAPYRVSGRWYVPREEPGYDQTGMGSWYGSDFHGRKTANGEVFDMDALTAAHPTLPLPSYAYVTNLSNNRTVLVRINDRGPYANDRIIDLSRRVARELGTEGRGVAQVRVRYAGRAPLDGSDAHERRFLAAQPWSGGGGSRYADVSAAPVAPATVAGGGQYDGNRGVWSPSSGTAATGSAAGWNPNAYRAGLAGQR